MSNQIAHLITLEEQIDRWVAGESLHRATGGHGRYERLGDVAESNRWHCPDCGKTGTIEELRASDCPLGNYECCPDFSCCYPYIQNPFKAAPGVRGEVEGAADLGAPRSRDRWADGP